MGITARLQSPHRYPAGHWDPDPHSPCQVAPPPHGGPARSLAPPWSLHARTAAKSHTPCSFLPCTRPSGAQITNHLTSSCRGGGGVGGATPGAPGMTSDPSPWNRAPACHFLEQTLRQKQADGRRVNKAARSGRAGESPDSGRELQSRDPRSRVTGTPRAGDGQGTAGRHT